jgi:hypothetical protein
MIKGKEGEEDKVFVRTVVENERSSLKIEPLFSFASKHSIT